MTNGEPIAYIEDVALNLRNDGFVDVAEALLKVHVGMFNRTEQFMAWRSSVERIMKDERISEKTRKSVENAWNYFRSSLS